MGFDPVRLSEVESELRKLHEDAKDTSFTDEQQTAWDGFADERKQLLDAKAAEERQLEERRNQVAALAASPTHRITGDGATGGPQLMRRTQIWDGRDVRSLTVREARDKALAAVDERELTGHLDERQLVHMDRLVRTQSRNTNGAQIARRILVTESEAYRTAFMKIAARPNPVLTPEEGRALTEFDEYRAMALSPDSAGGFGVPVFIDPTVILTAQGHPNDFFAISRVETITNDQWLGVSSAGVTWSFDAEATAVSDDSPTLAQPSVVAHKAQGFIPYSIEIGMDYPGFAEEMSRLLASGYSELLVEKFTTGSGTNEPFGIVTALDANTNVEVSVTTDGAFGAVDVYNLWAELPIRYRPRASWMSHVSVQNEVRQFGNDANDANYSINLTQMEIPALFGRNYYTNDYMDEFTGTTGAANLLIVGDFRNYLIAQRAGMTVELVPHLFDVTNNRPTGQRGWYAWARVGADSINDLGFRILQNT